MNLFAAPSAKAVELKERLSAFMDDHVYPNERVFADQHAAQADRWDIPAVLEDLKIKARSVGLWNLFLAHSEHGPGLTNLEYAPLCEIMGRSWIAPEVFNCAAPDTGNMEVLDRYGDEQQKAKWLTPLIEGRIRSGFAMTEPAVASSDATNIATEVTRDGDDYVINGCKWWCSGGGEKRCAVLIVMGRSNADAAKHQQQSMILVPRDAKGVRVVRALNVFGYDHAPFGHWEIEFRDVRVPASNMLLGEGRGFEIAQGRLGPGRIHHCMRVIGQAERALDSMIARVKSRRAFGKTLAEQGSIREAIAWSRIEIEQARLLVLKAAHVMDVAGNKAARSEIAMIKVLAPNMAQRVFDRAIQAHGGAGVSQDFGLAHQWSMSRGMRIFDGPDEVHLTQVAKLELGRETSLWTE